MTLLRFAPLACVLLIACPLPDDTGGSGGTGGTPPSCEDNEIWDATAGHCAWFPGGGYGWAGCSMSTHPPAGHQCVTGTHYVPCDCACDLDNMVWDPAQQRCTLVPDGGNGWAGCSMSTATDPPAGYKCITGTHWDHCDCECNTGTWNASTTHCE